MASSKRPPGTHEVREPVSLYDAKTNLSELVELAAGGMEIVIMKSGKPMARLGPLSRDHEPRTPGKGRGRWRLGADFDAPLPDDVLRHFSPE